MKAKAAFYFLILCRQFLSLERYRQKKGVEVKGTQAWNFCLHFFAETETLWSQGPVTQDFWKLCSIRPRYSTFKHFCVCSASDKIYSAYAQPAMKFVPRILSMNLHVKTVQFYCWLSMRENSFLVCSVCDEIISSDAQCAIKSFPRMLSMRML